MAATMWEDNNAGAGAPAPVAGAAAAGGDAPDRDEAELARVVDLQRFLLGGAVEDEAARNRAERQQEELQASVARLEELLGTRNERASGLSASRISGLAQPDSALCEIPFAHLQDINLALRAGSLEEMDEDEEAAAAAEGEAVWCCAMVLTLSS